VRWMADCMPALHTFRGDLARSSQVLINCPLVWEGVFSSKKVLAVDFRHCQVLDPVGDAVAFPKSIEFWKDRRIPASFEKRPAHPASGECPRERRCDRGQGGGPERWA
jgi:hypothetical protein